MLPDLAARDLSKIAAAEMAHFILLEEHLSGMGVAVEDAMVPFVATWDSYHASTAPRSWLESIVKVYLGHGLAADLHREIGWLPGATGELVQRCWPTRGTARSPSARRTPPARPTARRATGSPRGRRLLGEAVTQAEQIVAERDELAAFIITGTGDLSGIVSLLKRVQFNHGKRMAKLGLN